MKEYEKPLVGIIDFAAEEIMDDVVIEGGGGFSNLGDEDVGWGD